MQIDITCGKLKADLYDNLMKNFLEKKLSSLAWLNPRVSLALSKKNISSFRQLLFYLPRKYEDRSSLLKIKDALQKSLADEDFITSLVSECIGKEVFPFKNRNITKYFFSDNELTFSISAFNPMHHYSINNHYLISGKLRKKYNEIQMNVHESEPFSSEELNSLNFGRIVPIYRSIERLTQKKIRETIKTLLTKESDFTLSYRIDNELIKRYKMNPKKDNLKTMHFPETFKKLNKARQELAYEEFYLMQRKLAKKKQSRKRSGGIPSYTKKEELFEIIKKWPNPLTKEQKIAIDEVLKDLDSEYCMNRLLQGEVGSGKTWVALAAMVYLALNNRQSVLLVPTAILAKQHVETIKKMLKGHFQPALLIANQNIEQKKKNLIDIKSGVAKIIVGTHAIYQEKIDYQDLALAIIDEQHRFGVEQREALKKKGKQIDTLSLSATPIPRSLSLTLFGDMEKSELKTRPSAMHFPKSKIIFEDEISHAFQFILSRVKKGEQGFIVFPIIDESKKGELKSLLKEYDKLQDTVFANVPTAFVHGKLKPDETDLIMEKFRSGDIKILFCTTVLEVGIDHPNATVMLIEGSDRFGLSQLHQLRGRVGRHLKQGYCYLVIKRDTGEKTQMRLEKFVKTIDGFEIAELDLEIRGPGEMAGLRQSGLPKFLFANLQKDFSLLIRARKDAFQLKS